jgi:hypothetical protein
VPALPGLRDSSARTEENIRAVAEALEAAAAKADEAQAVRDRLTPSEAEARWVAARNAACTARAHRTAALARPRSVEEIGTFAQRWLAFDRAHDRRIARLRPPAAYRDGARRLARLDDRQEQGLHRVVAAAERRDASGTLAEVRSLQALAGRANPTVAELGLTACFLPTAGLPY